MATRKVVNAKAIETPDGPISFPVIPEGDRDVEAITQRMVGRVLGADSLDGLFDALTGNTSEMLIGKTLEIHDVEWDTYESDTGPIPKAVCTAFDCADGSDLEFVTTSPMLTAFIRKAQVLGIMPFKARIEGKKTRGNQTALNFVRP